MKMQRYEITWVIAVVLGAYLMSAGAEPAKPKRPAEIAGHETAPDPKDSRPSLSLAEARTSANLLHETIHAALRVVHRDYYREDEGLPLPARSLQEVFDELDRSSGVMARWLVVDAEAMNVDHLPRDEFERRAAQAIASGEKELEVVDNGVYRRAGLVVLSSECLKCHMPSRTSTRNRAAGLVIGIPIQTE
jgi:hypothetical protein